MKINIKKLNPLAKLPNHGSEFSAGYDLYAAIDQSVTIAPHATEKIGTGLAMELPHGYFGAIFARSGLATKHGVRPSNCVGVCDEDYTGEYIVALHNDTDIPYTIEPQERIAQLVVMSYLPLEFQLVPELNETKRGDGGFGSTGTI